MPSKLSHVLQVTQLGHVKDLATAFVKVLDNSKASKQVCSTSGERLLQLLCHSLSQ